MNDHLLAIYLKDHLAAGVGGIELSRRMRGENEDNVFGDALATIVAELEEDRDVLLAICEILGVDPSRTKMGAAWLGEKASRLKLNGQLTGYSPLSRLVEIEALLGGVEARRGLWATLKTAAPHHEKLSTFDLERFETRAEDQIKRLRHLHTRAAELAVVGNSEG